MRMAFAEETGNLFYSIVRETLPRSDQEWVLDLRFATALEQAFFQYYEIRSRHWQLLASLFFSVLLCLRLLAVWALSVPVTPAELLCIDVLIGGIALPLATNLINLVFQIAMPLPLQRTFLVLSLLIPLAIGHYLLWRDRTIALQAASTSIFLSAALIALVMRMRVRNALPLLIGINTLMLGTSWLIDPLFLERLMLPAMMSVAFGMLGSFLFEYDARRDFLSQAHVRQIAVTDQLSQALNRYAFYDRSHHELERARRQATDLSILLIDIDHFKQINDRYGHLVGDQTISLLGTVCLSHIRAGDLIGRIGGEEFAILMPEINREAAILSGEQLRVRLEQSIALTIQPIPSFTISIGVAHLCDHDRNIQDLVARADACLYQAKRAGRDRIVAAASVALELDAEPCVIDRLTADIY